MLSGRLETILRGILGIPLRILSGSPHGSPRFPSDHCHDVLKMTTFTLVVQLWPS